MFRAEQQAGFEFLGKITVETLSQVLQAEPKQLKLVDAALLGETLYLLTENALYLLPRTVLKLTD
jgi:hypothetical protein